MTADGSHPHILDLAPGEKPAGDKQSVPGVSSIAWNNAAAFLPII
jgi:hypothetical protein